MSSSSYEPPPRSRAILAGPLPFSEPTALAPMEGVTHPTLRSLLADKGGIGLLCTEFVRISRAPLALVNLERAVVKVPGVPLSVQVMGRDADKMADAAEHVGAHGADVVDINLGCPMPRAVKGGVGAAMLTDLALLYEVLTQMRDKTSGLMSAKIRAGFDDTTGALRIGRTVEAAGVDFITVHPRSRRDLYTGVADWRIIRSLRDELSIPVIGNGDVWYAADVQRMRDETGCDAVMIGRPALRNPWIFAQAAALRAGRAPQRPDGDALAEWFHLLRATYQPVFGHLRYGIVGKMKEHVRYLGRVVDDERSFRTAALRAPDVDTIMSLVDERIRGLPAERLDLQVDGHLGFERSGSAEESEHAA